jgi:hypothetical protein
VRLAREDRASVLATRAFPFSRISPATQTPSAGAQKSTSRPCEEPGHGASVMPMPPIDRHSGQLAGAVTNPTSLPAAAMTIIPDSTAVLIASRTAPANPTPPRLIETTSQPARRARSIAMATSPSKTWTTLLIARSGTSATPGAAPWISPGERPAMTLPVAVP